MWLRIILLIAILLVSEALLRRDYLERKVFKWQTSLLILFSVLLRLLFLWQNMSECSVLLQALLWQSALLFLPMLSFILLYRFIKQPGPADIKFIFCLFLLLDAEEVLALVIVACLWACLSELWRRKKAGGESQDFAFLPYLFLCSWPFICQRYGRIGV